MLKVSFFQGETEAGPSVIPLLNRATDGALEKTAGTLLPDVVRYIDSLRPRQDAVYNLVNAMGAGEYFGSNINGDYFTEASLIHRPDEWTGNPLVDKIKAKDWAYGFPTFYSAHPYAHHRNKDASRAFGEVELAVWNDGMKRVELVTRCDKDKCLQYGGVQVWDKLIAGHFPDVSMGCKVPFDTCSICLDWKKYRDAQATFNPKKHKHPGEAVLEVYRSTQRQEKNDKGQLEWVGQGAIRGVSVTRKDYCEHARKQMNRILRDGRKVFVFNDYPRFFDISFVFIGADKTAKTMMKIASSSGFWDIGASAEMAEKLGYSEEPPAQEKTASAFEDLVFEAAFGKNAKAKKSEITKDIVPSQFANKAVGALTASEKDLPRDLLNLMGRSSLEGALSTTAGLGMVLRPREFQRIVLVQLGANDAADDMDMLGEVFPRSEERAPLKLDAKHFIPALVRLLLPFLMERSAITPALERRLIINTPSSQKEKRGCSSLSSDLLRKIGAAYNSYRDQLMDLVANAQDLIGGGTSASAVEFRKLSSANPEEVFGPLSVEYIANAFLDEQAEPIKQARADVERGFPSRNT